MRKPAPVASLLFFLIAFSACHAVQAQRYGWLGTWTTANYAMPADGADRLKQASHLGSATITIRQVVHLSQGGRMVRVRLSNEFGTAPLTISAARIAFLSTGSTILPGTDKPLRFRQQTSVTIPAGGFVASDAVTERMPIFSDLVISLALPAQKIPVVTFHNMALQTAFFANGDQTSTHTLSSPELQPPGLGSPDTASPAQAPVTDRPVTSPATPGPAALTTAPLVAQSGSWFFLKDVEVDATRKSSAVVCLGDSITDGTGSTTETNRRYPDVLEGLAAQLSKTMYVSMLNAGIGGNRLLAEGAGPDALTRLERDVLSQPGARTVLLLEGINDIGASRGAIPAQPIVAALTDIASRAHAHGLRIYAGTLTPFEGAGYYTEAGEQTRQQVNVFLRSNTVFDGIIDFDKSLQDPAHPARLLPRYDHGDHLHPSDLGYAAMASAVPIKFLQRRAH